MVLWPVPYRLSKRCLVSASLTAMMGKRSAPSRGHGAQPDDPGGGLLGARDHRLEQIAAALVQLGDEVGAVIHRDVRPKVEHGLDVAVVAR